MVNSPALKKPKNPVHAAAHNITLSGCAAGPSQTAFSFLKIAGVIGSLGFDGWPNLACARLIPESTCSRTGIDLARHKSPCPNWICAKLTAER